MRSPKRKAVRWFLWGILGCLFVAGGSYFWATSLMAGAQAYRSPLVSRSPEPAMPLNLPPLTRRVVFVLIDALRYDTAAKLEVMPFLNELRSQGAQAIMHSRPPSFSAPAWTTLLTGAWADINDGQLFNPPDNDHVRAFSQDNLFAAAERKGLKTAVSGYVWFEGMLKQAGVDAGFYTEGEDMTADREVVTAAMPWLESKDYALILIHLDQVDYAGHHEGGPRDPRWEAAARRVDDLLREIASRLDLTQDTLVVLSDHGQIERGGHGGPEAITLIEPFVMVGAGVRPGSYDDVQMVDVAPTIAVLLGLNLPAISQGHPLTQLLWLDQESLTKVQAAEVAQKAALLQAYEEAIGSRSARRPIPNDPASYVSVMEEAREGRLGRERVWRNMLAAFLILLPPYVLYLRREKRALPLLLGALLYVSVFNFRYAVLDERTYSLSSVESQEWLISYVGVTAAIACLVGWLVAMLLSRAFVLGARQAATLTMGYLWLTLYLLALPVLISFALNGALVSWTLPEFYTMYLALLSIIQAIIVAALGLILTGLAAGIGKLDALRRA